MDERYQVLLKHFSGMIQTRIGEKCQKKEKPHWRLAATAIVYFRRFYLVHSLLDYDPRVIMLAAVLLAGKTEECRINLEQLQDIYNKCTPEEIQAGELLLLEALHFELSIEHPKSLVSTFIADFKRIASKSSSSSSSSSRSSSSSSSSSIGANSSSSTSRDWSAAAESVLLDLQVSDASLRFSSATIAICALRDTEPSARYDHICTTTTDIMNTIYPTTTDILTHLYHGMFVVMGRFP